MNRRLPRQPGIKTDSHDLNLAHVKVWRKRLRDGVNAALKLKNVPGDERRDLEWALKRLSSLDEFVKIIRTLPYRHTQTHALDCLLTVIGISFVVGSRASLSETQRVYQQSVAQSARGKTSGKARAARAWHEPAREFAIKTRAANPRISNAGISESISVKVRGAPSPRQVRPFLTALQRAGDLPAKTR
jgi:hypothetical protein